MFPMVAALFSVPSSAEGLQFLHVLANTWCLWVFGDSPAGDREGASHWGFDLYFPN